MLLPREQSPWNCGYALGAFALRVLDEGAADVQELQHKMSSLLGRTISPTQVVAAACWLYLIDSVRLADDGKIEKCD